jgi:phosphatidylglycerol:prolipoprotein diacylglycerol transferase
VLPVLFAVTIPQGWGKPLALLLVLGIAVGRALAYLWRLRAEGGRGSFLRALRDDALLIGILAAVAALLWRTGLLDGEIRLPVHSYGLLIATGFLVGIWLAQREARRRGQDAERIADLTFWIAVAAIAGSQLYFILVNWRDYFGPGRFLAATPLGTIPRFLVVWQNGLVFYGGFIGAALAAFWYMRKHRLPFLAYADTIIPSVAIGHFFGRLGCFAAGCCWGGAAHGHLPWAVRFPRASLAFQTFVERADPAQYLSADRASTLPLHPTQLYESFGELALFLLLVLWIRPRKRFHGQALASWLVMYAVLRSTVELFRGDVERGVWLGLGAGQWTSLVILAVGALIWLRAPRRAVAPGPAAPV